MSDNQTVKGVGKLNSANTPTNAAAFMVEQIIRQMVNTAEIVSINSSDAQGKASAGGRAKATPMVSQTDGWGNALPTTPLPALPFYRPQAGKAAIIMEPQPGDKALAVFVKRDSSGLAVGKNEASPPGSHRIFDQADGFLINGILGEAPELWLQLDPASGKISLSTKAAKIDISCRESGDIDISTGAGNMTLTATGELIIKCPQITLDGNVRITGSLATEGESTGPGGGPAVFSSGIRNKAGGITDQDVTVKTHTHAGIEPGGGNTASPNAGSCYGAYQKNPAARPRQVGHHAGRSRGYLRLPGRLRHGPKRGQRGPAFHRGRLFQPGPGNALFCDDPGSERQFGHSSRSSAPGGLVRAGRQGNLIH
jgi:hypothetical protein